MDLTSFLLDEVKRTPGMYLFEPKLLNLNIFITGYRVADQGCRGSDRFLDHFSDWFIKTTNSPEQTMWYPIILQECSGSEKDALNRFWTYLEAFDSEIKLER